jgi:hypothetical protein
MVFRDFLFVIWSSEFDKCGNFNWSYNEAPLLFKEG